jgi:hypothetical protein
MFWRRRQFVKGSLGMLAGGAIVTSEGAAQTSPSRTAKRSSTLFDPSALS